jgi:hypothetical protein
LPAASEKTPIPAGLTLLNVPSEMIKAFASPNTDKRLTDIKVFYFEDVGKSFNTVRESPALGNGAKYRT